MTTRSFVRIVSVYGVISLALASLASAEAAEKKAAPARAKAASAVMSRDELRACLDQKESVRMEGAALDKERTALAASKAALEKRSAELGERLALLDRTSASAVDSHNADVAEREKAVDAFQTQIAAFNARAGVTREHQQAFEAACGNKLYEVRDENAIRKVK